MFQALLQGVQPGLGTVGRLQAQRQHRAAHAAVGLEPCPGAVERGLQVALVEHDEHVNALGLRRDQRARQLAFGEFGIGGHQHQHLVEVGREGLGAHLVLPVEQVAPLVDALDAALVARHLPLHLVTHDHGVLLAAGVADAASAVGAFDEAMAAMRRHHQTGLQIGHQAFCRASTAAAQWKSLAEMPFTSCVLKRTLQRL